MPNTYWFIQSRSVGLGATRRLGHDVGINRNRRPHLQYSVGGWPSTLTRMRADHWRSGSRTCGARPFPDLGTTTAPLRGRCRASSGALGRAVAARHDRTAGAPRVPLQASRPVRLRGPHRGDHAPAQARGAEAAPHAGEWDSPALAAVFAARAHEAIAQDPALEVRAQLILDVARQSMVGVPRLLEKGLQVLGEDLVERFVLRLPSAVPDSAHERARELPRRRASS